MISANFDVNPNILTGTTLATETGPGPYFTPRPIYLPIRRVRKPGNSVSGITLSDLSFEYDGVIGWNVVHSTFNNLYSYGTRYGIVLEGTSSQNAFDEIKLQGGRYGVLVTNGDNNVYHNVSSVNQTFSFVSVGGQNQNFVHLLSTPTVTAPYGGVILDQTGFTFQGMYFDIEGYSNLRSKLSVLSPSQFSLFKGEFDTYSDSSLMGPPVMVDGGKGAFFQGSLIEFGIPPLQVGILVNSPPAPGYYNSGRGISFTVLTGVAEIPQISNTNSFQFYYH